MCKSTTNDDGCKMRFYAIKLLTWTAMLLVIFTLQALVHKLINWESNAENLKVTNKRWNIHDHLFNLAICWNCCIGKVWIGTFARRTDVWYSGKKERVASGEESKMMFGCDSHIFMEYNFCKIYILGCWLVNHDYVKIKKVLFKYSTVKNIQFIVMLQIKIKCSNDY